MKRVEMSNDHQTVILDILPADHGEVVQLVVAEDVEDVIFCMNVMYDLPTPRDVTPPSMARLLQFKSILGEEFKELDDIIDVIETNPKQATVDFADLLADICVFCISECMRHGIPWLQVYSAVMASNLSKLGEDGKPIKDDRGKFLKGPNYWKPEPLIAAILFDEDPT